MTKTVSVSSSLLLRPLPLLLLLFFFSQSPITVSAIVANRNFLSLRDQQDCYTHLVEADVNHDSQLDREEFVTFCNLSSPPNLLFAVTTVTTTDFDSLPLSLQAAFYSIACLCNSPSYGGQQQEEGGGQTITTNTTSSEESCCQGASAHVRVPTVGPLDEPSFQDKSYLFATCTVTNRAVEHEMRVHGGVTWPPTTATIPADTMSPSTSSSSSILQTEAPSILDVVPTMVPTTTSDQTTQEPTFTTTTTTTTTTSSALPTLLPTSQRLTVAPTSSTAPVFTASPTASPSSLAVSAFPTTMVPTIEESNGAAPTTTTTTTSVSVSYLIAIQRTTTNTTTTTASSNTNNNNNASHLSDLQAAMDQLAPKVLLEEGEQQSSSSSKRRRRRQLRPKQTSLSQQQQSQTNETTTTTTTSIQLQQQQQQPQQASSFVQLPTQLETVQTVDCPTSRITTDSSSSSNMECQEVTSIVQLMNADATTSANFDNNLKQAIDQGDLQRELLLINSDTPVQVLNTTTTAETTTTTTSDDDDEDVSKGLTAGIVVASVATVALVFVSITLLWNQKHLSRSQAAASRSKSNNVLPVINSDDDDDDKDAVPPLPTATESSGGSNLLLGPSYSTQATIMTSTSSHDTPSPPHHPYLATSVSSETTDSVRNLPNDVEAGLGVVSQQQQVVDKAVRDVATAQASGESTSSGATAVPVVSSDTSSMYAAAAIGGAAAAAMFGCGAGLVDATRSTSPTSSQDTPNQNNLTATESRDSGLPYVTLSTSSLDVEELEEEEKEDKTATNTTSRQRLDQAIQAGDWAAVGQIAAVLAASSPEQPLEEEDASASSMPLYSLYPSRSMESNISVEIAKMELLDQLVEKERWQDVMVMAAKFEAEAIMEQQSSTSQSRGESEDAESTSVNSRTTGGSFTGSEDLNTIRSSSMVSPTTSFTDSFGRTQLRAEIREEVVALVQMVVPEELDNVDEMMKQFHGREDELIETLRSMQERMVALKARSAMQKAAKAEARMQVKSQRQNSESDPHQSETADVDISALSEDDVLNDILGNQLENETFPGTGALLSLYPNSNRSTGRDAISNNGIVNDASIKLHTSALEHAVHVGNWQAVTEAAAVLSNAESLAVGSVGIDLLSENRDTVVDQQVNPMHLRELDDMIVAGNWSGVMEASKRLSKEGDSPSEERRSKEEEEALQQAALWEKIAEESKSAGGSNDAGAVDATEWAIQRSLSELNLKEQEQQSQQSSANEEADDRASDDEV